MFSTDRQTLTGTFDGAQLHDGHTDGKELSFRAQLTAPYKVKIKCAASVEGDMITGKAKAGIMTIAFGCSSSEGTSDQQACRIAGGRRRC